MNMRAKWLTAGLLSVMATSSSLSAQEPETPPAPAAEAAAPEATVPDAAEPAPAEPAAPVVAPADIEYKTLPLPANAVVNGRPSDAIQKLERGTVNAVIRGSEQYGPNEARFKAYYTRYLFPLMTQTSPEQLANLTKLRMIFFRDHMRRGTTPGNKEVYALLVDMTYSTMKEIVQENYHPAARYNAMLIIGDLNTKEAITGGGANAAPAEPLAEARNFMLKELVNPQQLDAVKMAALIGLQRHAELNAGRPVDRQWPAAERAAIVKQLLPLATDKTVPANRTPEGHAWLRGRVVDVLATMSQAGLDNDTANMLVKIVSDDSEPISLRLVAADGVARLNLANSPTLKGNEVGRKLADLLIASSRKQLAKLSAEIAAEKARTRGQYGPGGPSMLPRTTPVNPTSRKDPESLKQEQRLLLVRRILKDDTVRVANSIKNQDGTLGAMSAAKAAPQKDYLTKLHEAIGKLSKVADLDPEPDLTTLEKEMRIKLDELERVAKTSGPPAAAPRAAEPETPEGPGELPTSPVSVPVAPAGGAKK